jgi:ribosomal protein L14
LEVFPLFVREKINFLKRDMEKFAGFGYSQEKADELDVRIGSYEAFPTDQEFEGDVMIATEKKNVMSEDVTQKIRAVMMRVQERFGRQSAYYKKFDASALSNVTDGKLVNSSRRVARVAKMYLSELQEKGLTQEHIDELFTMADDFAELKELQKDTVADREIGTAQ